MLGTTSSLVFFRQISALILAWLLFLPLKAVNVDSLEQALANAPDTAKVRILSDLAWVYNFSDAQKSLEYADQELDLARALADSMWLGRAFNDLGIAHIRLNNYDKAIQNLKRSLKIRRRLPNQKDVASSISKIALVHQLMGNYQTSLEHQFEALEIFEDLEEHAAVAHTLSNIGYLYEVQQFYDKAEENYRRAERLYQIEQNPYGEASIKHKLASLFSEKEDFVKSISLEKEALSLFTELDYDFEIVASLINLGYYYENTDQGSEAVSLYEQAYRKAAGLQDIPQMMLAAGNLGDYWMDRSPAKALAAYQRQIDAAERMGLSEELKQAWANLASAQHTLGKNGAAYVSLEKVLNLSDSLHLKSLRDAEELARLEYQSKSIEREKRAVDNEVKVVEQTQRLTELEDQVSSLRIYLIVAVVLLVALAGLWYNSYRKS